jgi:hypothetical protein
MMLFAIFHAILLPFLHASFRCCCRHAAISPMLRHFAHATPLMLRRFHDAPPLPPFRCRFRFHAADAADALRDALFFAIISMPMPPPSAAAAEMRAAAAERMPRQRVAAMRRHIYAPCLMPRAPYRRFAIPAAAITPSALSPCRQRHASTLRFQRCRAFTIRDTPRAAPCRVASHRRHRSVCWRATPPRRHARAYAIDIACRCHFDAFHGAERLLCHAASMPLAFDAAFADFAAAMPAISALTFAR